MMFSPLGSYLSFQYWQGNKCWKNAAFIFLSIFFLFRPQASSAQQSFSRYLGSDSSTTDEVVNSYIPTSDGGSLFGGYVKKASEEKDLFLTKVRADGTIEWSISFGGQEEEELYDICQLESGAYSIVGVTSSFGGFADDPFVVKVSQNGSIIWARYYEGDYSVHRGVRIQETHDGNYLIAGTIVGYVGVGIGWGDMYLLELAPDGTVRNATIMGNTNDDDIIDFIEEPDGDIVVTGYSNSYQPDGFRNILLIKLNASLDQVIWKHSYQEANSSLAQDLIKTSDGGYAITGSDCISNSDSCDMILIKADSLGGLEWSNNYDGGSYEIGVELLDIDPSTLAMIGNTRSLGQGSDLDMNVNLIDKNDQGSIERSILIGGAKNDAVRLNRSSSITGPQNDLLIGGWTFSFGEDSSSSNIYLQKIDLDEDPFCGAKPMASNMIRSSVGLTDNTNISVTLDSVSTKDSMIALTAEPFPLSSHPLCESLGWRTERKKSFKVSPNPADDRFSIHYPSGKVQRISIYDPSGKVIERVRSLNRSSIDLHIGDTPDGLYLIEILDQQGSVIRKKLIIQ